MIPTDLFGALLQALDMDWVKRLIFVGDPNQLPPIGPGRPFVDMVNWLEREYPDCVATLLTSMRLADDEIGEQHQESVALAFAEGFRTNSVSPGDDELLAMIARGESRGDLEVVFWNDHDELLACLNNQFGRQLAVTSGDYQRFNESLGFNDKAWDRCESWQILTPTRKQYFGTDDINRQIQLQFRKGLMISANHSRNNMPKSFGEQDLVVSDKVIQVVNRVMRAWPRQTGLDYVANGEIGLISNTTKARTATISTFTTLPNRKFHIVISVVT